MSYTTEQALRGDGGPELQKVVRAHVEQRQRQGGYEISCAVRGIEVMRHPPQASTATQPRARRKPGDNPNAWMSPDLQKFYRHIERKHKLDKDLASLDPNSLLARKVKIERELELMKQDADHAENWARKKELDRKNAAKDPWAAYRLF